MGESTARQSAYGFIWPLDIIDFHTYIVMRLNLPLWFSYLVTKRLLKFSRGGVNGDNYWCQDLHLAAQTYPRITRDYRSIYIRPIFLTKKIQQKLYKIFLYTRYYNQCYSVKKSYPYRFCELSVFLIITSYICWDC